MTKVPLNTGRAVSGAMELTKVALEQKLIPVNSDPKETARSIMSFYETILESFLKRENQE